MREAGAEMFHAVDRMDTIAAEDALNKLNDRRLALTYDEKMGYANVKGANAATRPLMQEYGSLFGTAVKEIGSGLQNDRQREKFALRAQVAETGFKEGLLRHVVQEHDAFETQVLSDTVKSEKRMVAADASNPYAVDAALERLRPQVEAEAKRKGRQGAVGETMQELKDGLWTEKLDARRLTDPVGAYEEFRTNAKQVSPKLAVQLDAQLFEAAKGPLAGRYVLANPPPQDKPEAPGTVANEPPKDFGGFNGVVKSLIDNREGTKLVLKDGKSGKPAKFGINQAANPDIDVANLTRPQAEALYKARYWDAIGADNLAPATAVVAFDTAVLQGVEVAKRLLKTTGGDPQAMINGRRTMLMQLAANDPAHAKELPGWMNRLDKLDAEVNGTTVQAVRRRDPTSRDKIADIIRDPSLPTGDPVIDALSPDRRIQVMASAQILAKQDEDVLQKNLTNGYVESVRNSRDSIGALDVLEGQVSADKRLDWDRQNMVLNQIYARRHQLQTRLDMEQRQREAKIAGAIKQVDDLILSGFPPKPEQMAPLLDAARGTALEPQAQQMVATAQVTQAFARGTPQQQEATLTAMTAAARKDPTKFDVKVVGRLQQIYDAQQKAVQADPTTFAVRQGLVDAESPAAAPLDVSKPEAMGEQLAARMGLAREVSSRYQAPLKPLTKEEADTLAGTLRTASPELKVQYFGKLSQAFGGDRDGYMAAMAQIAPDDPVTAIAGAHAGAGRPENAALIARGQGYLNPPKKADGQPLGGKLIELPPDGKFEAEFSSKTENAFAGNQQARSASLQAVRAAYAALASDKGGETALKTVDSDLFEKAMDAVIGKPQAINGRTVILPYGYTTGQFKDGLAIRLDDLKAKGTVPDTTMAKLGSLPMRNVGDSKYVFVAGDSKIVDKAGREILIDFTQPAPFRSSGYGMQPPPPKEPDAYSRALRDSVPGRIFLK